MVSFMICSSEGRYTSFNDGGGNSGGGGGVLRGSQSPQQRRLSQMQMAGSHSPMQQQRRLSHMLEHQEVRECVRGSPVR